MSDYFPQDILIQILSRLPVKILLRFRCVSKRFRSLIKDDNFIRTHINFNNKENNENKNRYILFRHYYGYPTANYQYSLHNIKSFDEYMRFQCPFSCFSHNLTPIGSCNGLICLVGYPNVVVLWNPSTRDFLRLPEASVPDIINGLHTFVIGFGFDSRLDDYKVVKVVYRKRIDGSWIVPPDVEVFELRKGVWKNVVGASTMYVICGDELSQVYVNGSVHWIVSDRNVGEAVEEKEGRYRNLIVLFDMGDEVFREMDLPDVVANEDVLMSISASRGSLLALCYDRANPNERCIVWVMKEYGVAESWTKQFVINQQGLTKAVSLMGNGEVLLMKKSCKELVLFDPEREEIKEVGPRGSSNMDIHVNYVDTCIESLVLLKEASRVFTGPAYSCNVVDSERPPRYLREHDDMSS